MSPFRAPRRRAPRAAFAALALLLIASLSFGACSRDSDDDASPDSRSSTTSSSDQPGASADLTVKPGVLTVESAGPDARFDRHTVYQITKTVNTYLRTGVTSPFVSGTVGPRFPSLFGQQVRDEVTAGKHDRAVLSDEGAPRLTGPARAEGSPLDLTGLADDRGALVMASARVGMRLTGPTKQGDVKVERLGDLLLEPTSSGRWIITGYSMIVLRDDGTGSRASVSRNTPTTSDMEGAP